MTLTFVACGPLPDSPSSYSTFAPSASVRNPSPAMPEKCTNASFPPSSGVMKPKPFSSLNHLTTPVAIQHLLTASIDARGVLPGTAFPHASEPPTRRTTTGLVIPASRSAARSAGRDGRPAALAGVRRGVRLRLGLRSEEHTSELQSHSDLVCRLLLEKKKKKKKTTKIKKKKKKNKKK